MTRSTEIQFANGNVCPFLMLLLPMVVTELNWIESLYFMLTKNACSISRSYHKVYV